MIKALKQFFDDQLNPGSGSQLPDHELQVAAAALLFEISYSDRNSDGNEREMIRNLVTRQFMLSAEEANTLVDLAEQEARDATSLHGFVSLINKNWTEQQRVELVEFMWRIAYSDQKLNDHEVHLMRKVQRLLYVPHKQFIGAKLRAKDASDG